MCIGKDLSACYTKKKNDYSMSEIPLLMKIVFTGCHRFTWIFFDALTSLASSG